MTNFQNFRINDFGGHRSYGLERLQVCRGILGKPHADYKPKEEHLPFFALLEEALISNYEVNKKAFAKAHNSTEYTIDQGLKWLEWKGYLIGDDAGVMCLLKAPENNV